MLSINLRKGTPSAVARSRLAPVSLHVVFSLASGLSIADADWVHEDTERCVRAVQSKDARFDGWFFTAVLTTGIYCRPSCPAVTPKPRNMRFFASAAAAQQSGFRACKRCRPDASPGSPEWNQRADLVARAMRFIADGVVDRDGVSGLALEHPKSDNTRGPHRYQA